MALASLLPAPVSLAREGSDEQRINAIPKRSASSTKKYKMPSARADLPPVLRERQSVLVPRNGRLPDIVVPLPQVARRDLSLLSRFLSRARSLLTRKFRVAI
jgi:hypothetical protein